jgi:hypothetical protein
MAERPYFAAKAALFGKLQQEYSSFGRLLHKFRKYGGEKVPFCCKPAEKRQNAAKGSDVLLQSA